MQMYFTDSMTKGDIKKSKLSPDGVMQMCVLGSLRCRVCVFGAMVANCLVRFVLPWHAQGDAASSLAHTRLHAIHVRVRIHCWLQAWPYRDHSHVRGWHMR